MLALFQLEKERDAHLMPRLNKSPTPESSPESSPEPVRKRFHAPPTQPQPPESDDEQETGIIIPPHPSHPPPPDHSDSSNDAQMDNNGRDYDQEDMESRSPMMHHPHDQTNSQSMSQSMSHFFNSNGPMQQQQSAEEVMQTVHRGFTGVGGPGASNEPGKT
jgi:hypothetical protein